MPLLMSDFITEAQALVKDIGVAGKPGILQPTDWPALVARALSVYSRIRPLEFVIDVETQGAPNENDMPVSQLTGFDREFSGTPFIEFPISLPGDDPNWLDERAWMYYNTPNGLLIRFSADQVEPSAPIRFQYNVKQHVQRDPVGITGASNASPIQITTAANHNYVSGARVAITGVGGNLAANGTFAVEVVDATHFNLVGSVGNGAFTEGGTVTDPAVTSLPYGDFHAFCKLVGAEGCKVLANYYTFTSEGSIVNVDLSVFRSKGADFAKRAQQLTTDFNEAMGVNDKTDAPAAATTVANWDLPDSRDRDRLTHKRIYR
jgi:hypothetical protein